MANVSNGKAVAPKNESPIRSTGSETPPSAVYDAKLDAFVVVMPRAAAHLSSGGSTILVANSQRVIVSSDTEGKPLKDEHGIPVSFVFGGTINYQTEELKVVAKAKRAKERELYREWKAAQK